MQKEPTISSAHKFLPSMELIEFDASPGDTESVDPELVEREEAQENYEEAQELMSEGNAVEAELLFRKVLTVVERQLGTHRATADVLVNISIASTMQGKYAAAKLHAHRAISIFESLPGAQTDVARILNNMAAIYTMQELYPEGEYCLRRALQVMESAIAGKAVALDHPLMVPIMENQVRLLELTQRSEEAQSLRSRVNKLKAA